MIDRKFIIGDEWIYYKFYCGKRTADKVLVEVIGPLVGDLLKKKLVNQWFFIRYEDPNPHLRVRFHSIDNSCISSIINEVNKSITYYVDNDLIWKVQIDTYQREVERYGIKTMLFSEKLFHIDSEICLEVLDLIEDDTLLFLFSLKMTDNILSVFGLNLNQKQSFTDENLKFFKKEFNADKNLNKQLNKKYQSLRKQIELFMNNESKPEYEPLFDILDESTKKIEKLLNNEKGIGFYSIELLSSYIHMMINRLFRDKQRLHELVCYDFITKYYNGFIAKKGL